LCKCRRVVDKHSHHTWQCSAPQRHKSGGSSEPLAEK
jgi:hypothetical protein